MFKAINSSLFKQAWSATPLVEQAAWIYFIGNTIAVITLLEILLLK